MCVHTFESDDFTSRIHNRRISRYRSSDRIGGVVHIDDHYLGSITDLLSNANKLIRLHSEGVEADITGVDPHSRKLQK